MAASKKPVDLSGRKFGRLTPLTRSIRKKGKSTQSVWECTCDCGKITTVAARSLIEGNSTSCGCYRNEQVGKRSYKHGATVGRKMPLEYSTWCAMMSRCFDKGDAAYRLYGGRGITVCEKWRQFPGFFEDMGVRSKGKTLDRINPNGNYEIGNCRWATWEEQGNNKRKTVLFEYNGLKMSLAQWARHARLPESTVYNRVKIYKWDIGRAVSTPSGNLFGKPSITPTSTPHPPETEV